MTIAPSQSPAPSLPISYIRDVLSGTNSEDIRSLFSFTKDDPTERIVFKFNLWARHFFPKYFKKPDAHFHNMIDTNHARVYQGLEHQFVNIAFRGAAKTTRCKLFIAFAILNDTGHFRKYIKVLSKDLGNSKQITTDIYNMLIMPNVAAVYPSTFQKTDMKREETMASFMTYHSVKVIADTVGTDQRGALAEDARPDLIWFEDFETRSSLNSLVITNRIWENMDEARTSGAEGGQACGFIYSCNYISEMGNVHKLVMQNINVHITPITEDGTATGKPVWYYTPADIEHMRNTDLDFEGERLCKPSASMDVFFDRELLEKMEARPVIREPAGLRMYYKFDPSHRYGMGHDISGGVGLDSSTTVIIDFSTLPAKVVATYDDNTIKPDIFGDEIRRQADYYGSPICAPEANNYGHTTILRLRQLDVPLYERQEKATKKENTTAKQHEFGWHTNALTKPQMLFDLRKAISDGLLELSDPKLIAECKSYTRNDLMDTGSTSQNARYVTRHFDLLIACCIAWQMKDWATTRAPDEQERESESSLGAITYSAIGL